MRVGKPGKAARESAGGRPLLSLCVVARDEAKLLPRCLESVRGVADEIVLVDTGSTDETVAAAERYGARVFHRAWTGNLAAARNEALRQARGEWVLILDADEALTPEARRTLRGLLLDGRYAAYLVNIRSPLKQAAGPAAVINVLPRLFRNDPQLRQEGRWHERFPSLARAGAQVGATDLVVEHLGYHADYVDQDAKRDRNLALLQQELAERPDDPSVLFHLGETLGMAGRLAEAANAYRRALAQPGMARVNAAAAHRGLANCLLGLGDYEGALQACREAAALDGGFAAPRLLAAMAFCRLQRPAEAIAELDGYLRLAGQARPAAQRALEYEFPPGLGLALKGECLAALGRLDEAEAAFREAVRRQPDSREAILGLARLHVQRGGRMGEA